MIAELLDLQSGVVSRAQCLEHGLADHDIRRLLRRREFAVVHPGVYVVHTGPPAWIERAWAAVLACAPAALCHESARRAASGPGRSREDDGRPIQVAVDADRVLSPPDGVRVHRLAHLDEKVHWHTAPPRQRVEEATIDLAASAPRDIDCVAELADVVRSRQTTAARLTAALSGRTRIPRRALMRRVIADIGSGTCSALEHGYLTRVERPHGLPTAQRQFRDSRKGPLYRDAVYIAQQTIIDLDGRLFHSTVRDRDRDLERDLDAAVFGQVTARLGWGQVYERSCTTAAKVGALLVARGWAGEPRRCPDCPAEPGARAA